MGGEEGEGEGEGKGKGEGQNTTEGAVQMVCKYVCMHVMHVMHVSPMRETGDVGCTNQV